MGQKKIIRIVVDTNVVISGLLFGGVPGDVIDGTARKGVQLLVSKEIIHEYINVLSYPKFDLTEDEIEYLLYQIILPRSEIVTTRVQDHVILADDPSDDKFLVCAACGKADYLISGDAHLAALGRYEHTLITTPAEFMKLL